MPIRQPTSDERAYAWHRAALAGDPPPIIEDEPHAGWYKRRFNSDGVFVPAKIWLIQYVADGELTRPEEFACEIGGDRFDPIDAWVTLCANPITKSEFDHLMRVRDWAKAWRRDQPEADPTKPIDLFTVQPPTWGKKRKTRNAY